MGECRAGQRADALNLRVRGYQWWPLFCQRWPGWTILFDDDEESEWIDYGSKTIWLTTDTDDPDGLAVHAATHVWRHYGRESLSQADEDEADFYATACLAWGGVLPPAIEEAA